MQQNRVFILRGHPQATARAVLLKVTCVQAPQLNVGAPGQAAEFFLPPQFSADQLERLGTAVGGAESPSGGITLDTAVHPRACRSVDADAQIAPAPPTAWRVSRSPVGSCADRLGACATGGHQAQRGALSVRPRARPRDRLAQSDEPNAAPSYHFHQTGVPSENGI